MLEARLERPVFFGGCPRSGLTLLRAIMDGHPGFSAGPDAWLPSIVRTAQDFESTLGRLLETEFSLDAAAVCGAFASAVAAILSGRVAPGSAKPGARLVEKTPLNVLGFPKLAELFPDALFVHVVRDGRDVVASLLERAWTDPRSGRPLPQCANAAGAAKYWLQLAQVGISAEHALRGRIMRLSYEDLVLQPEPTLRQLTDFLGAPFSEEMLSFHRRSIALEGMEQDSARGLKQPLNASSVGRWRRDLDAAALAEVLAGAEPMLAALRYA